MLVSYYKRAKKAVHASLIAFIAALVAQVQAGATFDWKVVLLAIGVALVTHAGVYATTNA